MNTFGRRVGVEFFGDAAPLERSFANVAAATKEYGAISVATSAKVTDAQIAGTVKQIEALRAQQAEFAAAATSGVRSAKEQEAAQIRLAAVTRRIAAVTGESTAATAAFAGSARTAERDFGKTTRGILAGSGVFRGLGRSLAFASSGFIAVAAGATLIRSSIAAAETLAKAQASLSVAIRHTGGDVAKLRPEYEATAKAAAQFGVSQVDATTGLARATVLTGNASAAQRAYQEALLISKATGKDFNIVLTATAKGQEGITTSLRRYGILVKKGESGTQQFTQVLERFGGQARANTTSTDRLRAVFANTEAVIGKQLLPTFERLAGSLAVWLEKMNKTGQLQKDVNGIMGAAGETFHVLGRAIGIVDKVTGSFKHTLELLLGLKFASLASGWVLELDAMASAWARVGAAATAAGVAESGALAGAGAKGALAGAGTETVGGAAAGAGLGAALAKVFSRGGGSSVVSRVGQYTNATETAGAAAAGATSKIARFSRGLGELALILSSPQIIGAAHKVEDKGRNFLTGHLGRTGAALSDLLLPTSIKDFTGVSLYQDIFGGGSRNKPLPVYFDPQFVKFGGKFQPPFFPQPPGLPGAAGPGQKLGPFGTALPIKVYKTFSLNPAESITQAQVALTRSNADDVAAARRVVARIKRLIDQGHLAGKSLIQALQAEGSALSTIWSAEDAAAQKRAAAAQAAKARIQAQIENSIDPLKLEVALSRAQALGKPLVPYLKALRAAAEKALASGKLSLTQQKEAYDQIASLNQQIASAATTAIATFTAAPKLQLALAKDAALGLSQTKDLLKLKAAILKFIRTHRKNIQAEIDAYNQLAQVNQELGSTAQSALGLFKQASTKALTQGLGLTPAQRKALRERLSQLGPGGTVPGQGTGAYGYAIDPNTGRPIALHRHQRRRDASTSGGGGRPLTVNSNIDLSVYIDGKQVEATVTRRQQHRRRRNPTQRRGPNAATSTA